MIIDVIPNKRLPRGIGDTFSYNVPGDLESNIKPGQLVQVDFRNKIISALVKAVRPETHDKNLKPILKLLTQQSLVTPIQMRLAVWIANHYFTSLATATKLIVPDVPLKIKDSNFTIKESKKKNNTNSQLIWWTDEDEKEKAVTKEIAIAIKNNEQVLRLFPEFYQAKQIVKNGELLWQNNPGKKKNLEQWLKILKQETKTIVGTRSALFAPYQNLGLVIIEDEANGLYKSEITPRYHSREVAQQLTLLHGAKLLIISPAPSLETYKELSNEVKKTNNSRVKIIDIKDEREKENYSSLAEELQADITNIIKDNKKTFLFLNRRGHSANAICQDCGHTFLCPDCRLPLRYHTSFNILVCHHCRFRQELPPFCPKCSKPNLKLVGKGTQKLEQEITKMFTKATTYRIDSDVEKIDDKKLKKADIIIGTEYALSGARINWSTIYLIAALNADTALYRPDYRATERTYQQLTQLLHLNPKAQIYIQTYNPDNLAIKAIAGNNTELFYQEELKIRQTLGYPPYQDLIKLIYRNSNEKKTVGEAMHIYNRLRKHLVKEAIVKYPIKILKPFPAFERKERGKFKFHLILKIGPDAPEELYKKIRELVPADWVFDRDPETLL